jgi:hypothetical protein
MKDVHGIKAIRDDLDGLVKDLKVHEAVLGYYFSENVWELKQIMRSAILIEDVVDKLDSLLATSGIIDKEDKNDR